jgi:hypothetical protein
MGGKPSKGTPKDGRLKQNKSLPPWLAKTSKTTPKTTKKGK